MNPQSDFANSGSGLLRFRSAPSSLFANFTPSGNDIVTPPPTNPHGLNNLGSQMLVGDMEETKPLANLPPPYPRQSSAAALFSGIEVDSGGGSSNLTRQNSSPAGLFSHLNIHNVYGTLKGVGGIDINGDLSPSSRLRSVPTDFTTGLPPSSLGMLSQISEIENEGLSYPLGSWNDSSEFPDDFSPLKRALDNDTKPVGISDPNRDFEIRTNVLSRHLSLPKTSMEMASMEKLLQFQDTIPCKARAKRGCATHPRSIAERVRRTRISERMRKLQDLVPNMDKQTSTADMLDLAVEYIKQLQGQYKVRMSSPEEGGSIEECCLFRGSFGLLIATMEL